MVSCRVVRREASRTLSRTPLPLATAWVAWGSCPFRPTFHSRALPVRVLSAGGSLRPKSLETGCATRARHGGRCSSARPRPVWCGASRRGQRPQSRKTSRSCAGRRSNLVPISIHRSRVRAWPQLFLPSGGSPNSFALCSGTLLLSVTVSARRRGEGGTRRRCQCGLSNQGSEGDQS